MYEKLLSKILAAFTIAQWSIAYSGLVVLLYYYYALSEYTANLTPEVIEISGQYCF